MFSIEDPKVRGRINSRGFQREVRAVSLSGLKVCEGHEDK